MLLVMSFSLRQQTNIVEIIDIKKYYIMHRAVSHFVVDFFDDL